MSERENNVYLAKLSEQAERYDEMSDYMKAVAEISQELSVEVELPLPSVISPLFLGA